MQELQREAAGSVTPISVNDQFGNLEKEIGFSKSQFPGQLFRMLACRWDGTLDKIRVGMYLSHGSCSVSRDYCYSYFSSSHF